MNYRHLIYFVVVISSAACLDACNSVDKNTNGHNANITSNDTNALSAKQVDETEEIADGHCADSHCTVDTDSLLSPEVVKPYLSYEEILNVNSEYIAKVPNYHKVIEPSTCPPSSKTQDSRIPIPEQKPVSPIKTEVKVPIVEGTIDQRILLKIARTHLGQLRLCYEQVYKKNKKGNPKTDEFSLYWVISPDAELKTVDLIQTTIPGKKFETCILDAVKTWRFPKPKEHDETKITLQVSFKDEST